MAGSLILGLLDDQLICALHDGTIQHPRELSCRHSFCQRCLLSLAKRSGEVQVRCPTCKRMTTLPEEGVAGLRTPQDTMDLLSARNGLLKDEPSHSTDDYSLTLQPMSKILSSPTTPLSPTTNLLSPVVNSHIREDSYEDFQRDSFPRPRLQSLPNFPNPPPLPPHVPVIRGNGMPASFPSNDHMPHKRTETWYITCDRQKAAEILAGKRNGTFLIRPAGRMRVTKEGALHNYSIDLVYNGVKHLRVLKWHNMYGFNVKNCCYSTLLDLVLYYSQHPLDTHNPALTTTLAYPFNA